MSLKSFHIFFIVLATITVFGFGIWGVYIFLMESDPSYLLMGVISLASGVALIIYGIKFLQKLKNISYL